MNEQERHDLFVDLVTRNQSELYGYIYAVVRNWEDADDLCQSVCLFLWSKFDLFQPGTNFLAWARKVAKIKICEFLRYEKSPVHVAEDLIDTLAEGDLGPSDCDTEVYLAALRRCKEKLAADDEELLRLRYVEELSVVEIAHRLERIRQSVSRSLIRVRHWLFQCIQMELAKQEHSSRELT
jgi:RNA polymerase sigma-70 factor (ECF subfamily)